MKKVTLGFSILAGAALFVVGCGKGTPNVAPEQDTEVQSAIEAVWATYAVSDIDMVCGFLGEDKHKIDNFYCAIPNEFRDTVNGQYAAIRDVGAQKLIATWNRVWCLDGRVREGSIFMEYGIDPKLNPSADKNSYYYRVPGFTGKVTSLSAYKLDGWRISLWDPARPAVIKNLVPNFDYKTTETNLSWEINGKFLFKHPSDDPKKTIVWEGTIVKTLLNTNDPKVMSPKKDAAITWSLAICSYKGDIFGTVGDVPFKMHIESNPLIRDFTCRPKKIEDVTLAPTGSVVTLNSEHHPFIKGIASFTTAQLYPREIYFGNEGNPDLTQQCDNTGQVLIKGISYNINFRE